MNKTRMVCAVVAMACALFVTGSIAQAATVPNGTKILCVLGMGVDSRTVTVGTDFKLQVDDPTLPSLAGAAIHGHVTDVSGPGGVTRARIGFILDYIRFKNGTRAAIHANVVSKNVVQTNTARASAQQEAVKFSLPPMPSGRVTPGPIAWQMTFRKDAAPSVTAPPAGNTSGYVYAQKSNENIVIPPGAPVTIQLTSDLTTP